VATFTRTMDTATTYRLMRPEEAPAVCELVKEVFNQFVAPVYEYEGVREFLKYVDPKLLIRRSEGNHRTIVAESQGRIVGMVETRNGNHISLLFVHPSERRRGIGRGLMQHVVAMHDCQRMTVHSSPNAEAVYRRLGFIPDGPEQTKNGIRFVPMTWVRYGENDSGEPKHQVVAAHELRADARLRNGAQRS
jgi:GNAT superfamily N-acetyltransferase